MTQGVREERIQCSFCGRNPEEVTSIIAGPNVYICDVCVANSVDILKTNIAAFSTKKDQLRAVLKPIDIKAALDDYVKRHSVSVRRTPLD